MLRFNCRSNLLFLFVLIIISLIGCSKSETVEKKEKSVDASFITDLQEALEKRWNFYDDVKNEKVKVKDEVEYLEKLISFEKKLYEYENKDFNDPKLKKIALDYINGLKKQEESIKYYNVDLVKQEELWSKGYNARSTALLTLVDEYGLKVNEEQFKEVKTNAQLVKKQNEIEQKIQEMVRNIKFEKGPTEYDWTKYSTTLENTSGVDFAYFTIDINLLDKDGVVVGTAIASHDNTWKSGQKVLFEFETDITNFEKMEWEADYEIADSE
jgi:hypothetical protein